MRRKKERKRPLYTRPVIRNFSINRILMDYDGDDDDYDDDDNDKNDNRSENR